MDAWKTVLLTLIVFLAVFFGANVNGDSHPKPTSAVEFGISKHGGLHYVNGGFDIKKITFKKKTIATFHGVDAIVNINSLWTWQADASKADDPRRTEDLLGKDWFHAKKFPIAKAHIHVLPLNNTKNVKVKLTIKGKTKTIYAEVKGGYLLFRIVLKDFNLNPSWKSIFAGNFADVKVKLLRKI